MISTNGSRMQRRRSRLLCNSSAAQTARDIHRGSARADGRRTHMRIVRSGLHTREGSRPETQDLSRLPRGGRAATKQLSDPEESVGSRSLGARLYQAGEKWVQWVVNLTCVALEDRYLVIDVSALPIADR